jgi:hypothetical protein
MKLLLLIPAMALCFSAQARRDVAVASGTTRTAPGIGGYAQIGYAFAKGDRVSINATAEKQLDRMIVMVYPEQELGRVRATKAPSYSFVMPKNGIVIFRFISDRGGTNDIRYNVHRMPASDAVQRYNTRVVWDKPTNGRHGELIPRRAGR